MAEPFAQPVTKLGDAGIGVSAAPSGGMGLALDPTGKVPWSANPLIPVAVSASGSLTLTTADQDVPGCAANLPKGLYLAVGIFDFAHTVSGGGVAVGKLNVGGSGLAAEAHLADTGGPNGDRATVVQAWVFGISGDAGAITKLVALKTINAGTASAVITHTTLIYLRYN